MGKVKKKSRLKAARTPVITNPRKELRKTKRNLKKQNRKQYYERNQKNEPGKFVRFRPIDDDDDEEQPTSPPVRPTQRPAAPDALSQTIQQNKREEDKLKESMKKQRLKRLTEANEDEDKIIKKLEKQLNLKKGKSKNFEADGLDYLLELCDGRASSAQPQLAEDQGSDFEEDLAMATGEPVSDDDNNSAPSDMSDESEDDLDCSEPQMDSDEPMSPVNLESIYTEATGFPDGVFVPGELSPIAEEPKPDTNIEADDDSFEMEGSELDDSENDDSENYDSSIEDGEIFPPSEGSVEDENEEIIVNGKVINTYGRPIFPRRDDDDSFERCPKLDEILANISDTETDPKKSSVTNRAKDGSSASSSGNTAKIPLKRRQDEPAKHPKTKRSRGEDSDESLESDDEPESGSDSDPNLLVNSPNCDNRGGIWEDIYGRRRDGDGNVLKESTSGKYVPPHLRERKAENDSAESIELKRQIKGLLNKLSASNMHWTSSRMESIYNSHSRHSVNNAFISLWTESIVRPVASSERFIIEHVALVAVLHANVGSEIGAHFLQSLSKNFNNLLANDDIEGKELENLTIALSQLYNFKIFHSSLLYEFLNKISDEFSERRIDCLLAALRNIGGVLRKDDPASLKTFIQRAQERATSLRTKESGMRVNFLLDVLSAIKNNNLNKIPNYDPSYSEDLKKSLKGILRKGNTVVPLNIKLDDLLQAENRGRWWIVGSAWDNNVDRQNDKSKKNTSTEDNSYLMKLADTQRINTDLRRKIFCIVMSAEDYIDAFEKLQRMGLKNQQERDIIHVLISCCLQEAKYNPYYAALARKFCDFDRKFQMSIQYSVWDKIKDIDACEMFQISNLAQFLTHLIAEKSLPISVLKIVEFSDLTNASMRLMRQILLAILMNDKEQVCREAFQRISAPPGLRTFRESLRLFISHFLVKNTDKKDVLDDKRKALLKERSALVEKILQADSKFKF